MKGIDNIIFFRVKKIKQLNFIIYTHLYYPQKNKNNFFFSDRAMFNHKSSYIIKSY